MNKTVILLSSVGSLRRALNTIDKQQVVVIALDEAARGSAQAMGLECHAVSQYLQLSELELRTRADEFSHQWYLAGDFNASEFDQYSLGELMHMEVGYRLFFELERSIVFVQEILKSLNPVTWILATPQNRVYSYVIRNVSPQANIRSVAPRSLDTLKRKISPQEIKILLWKHGLDRYSRDLVFWLKNWKRQAMKPADKSASNILFVVDIPTVSILETLVPIIQLAPEDQRLVIATDPRCQSILERNGIQALPFDAHWLGVETQEIPNDLQDELHQRWKRLDAHMSANGLCFRGVDLWPMCRNDLRVLYMRRLATALRHFRLARQLIEDYHVAVAVAGSDIAYSGLLFVRAAERQSAKSMTIQHGMVNHPQGYLPIHATQMAVMGEAIREWCVQYGARPEQLVVTGQPRFDALLSPAKTPPVQLLTELELNPDLPTWLFTPERHLGLWMRDLVFDALEALPDVQMIIRVHQNDRPADYQLSLSYRPELAKRVRVSRQHDGPSVLGACAAILLGRSTMGLEALIVGKPMIAIHPANEKGWIVPPYLHDYLGELNLLRAQTPDELIRAWQWLRAPDSLEALERVRLEIVRRYAYQVDGKSAERVIQAIRQLGWHSKATDS